MWFLTYYDGVHPHKGFVGLVPGKNLINHFYSEKLQTTADFLRAYPLKTEEYFQLLCLPQPAL
jgi:hypothetical protein